MPKYRIGCSGFLYEAWKGIFYPEDLPHKKWLSFYMSQFNTVELNVTFYRLLKKEAFERWYKETPPDFTFCLKGSRFITHIKKLRDVELPLATFFNATAPLLEKLEVILWQLPPNLKLNLNSLEEFIEYLTQHKVRHVFEFRHKSWLTKRVLNLLSSANIAVCMADWPAFIDDLPVTADFVYIRRHGEGGNYSTNYTPEQLKKDARRIKDYLKLGKDVYFYFNNDAFAYAPKNARELIDILESTMPKSLKEKLVQKEKKPKKARKAKKKPVTKKKITPKKKVRLKKVAGKAAKRPVIRTKKKVIKKPVKKAQKKAAKKPVKSPPKKIARKAVKQRAKKSALKKAKKSIKKSPQKTTKKPARKKAR